MPDLQLPNTLSALRAPAPADGARERALHRATLAFEDALAPGKVAIRARRPALWGRWTAFSFAPILAAGLLALAFAVRPLPVGLVDPRSGSDAQELLAQLETVFPGQLDVVIERDGNVQLDFAEVAQPARTADQAMVIEFRRGHHRLRILAYSGRSVRAELDGMQLHFDALLTGNRKVLLSGEDFVWSSASVSPVQLVGWRIEAYPLVPIL